MSRSQFAPRFAVVDDDADIFPGQLVETFGAIDDRGLVTCRDGVRFLLAPASTLSETPEPVWPSIPPADVTAVYAELTGALPPKEAPVGVVWALALRRLSGDELLFDQRAA